MTALERNWAGNVTFTPQSVVMPTTVDQLQRDVATAAEAGRRVRAAGARHSFSPIGATDGTLVVMDQLSAIVGIDREAGTVMVEAGVRYADLAPALHDEGLALHNLASLPHLSVGGAIATSTHGSGVGNQSLAGAVVAMDVVTASGDIERIERGTDLGSAAIVGLGAFGVVARVSLRVEPTFDVAQDVFIDLPFDAGVEHLDEILGSAYSVSLFTNWRRDVFDQVWQKRRSDRTHTDITRFGAVAAIAPLHPVVGMEASACTVQGGRSGPWHRRLPHFRPDAVPSAGAELQTEYFVARADGRGALRAVQELRELLVDIVLVTEIRSIATDDFWLSPTHGRDSTAIHFTWRPDEARVRDVLPALEEALAPFDARPHWGKVTAMSNGDVRRRFPRFADAARLRTERDPDGVFLNDHLARLLHDPGAVEPGAVEPSAGA